MVCCECIAMASEMGENRLHDRAHAEGTRSTRIGAMRMFHCHYIMRLLLFRRPYILSLCVVGLRL